MNPHKFSLLLRYLPRFFATLLHVLILPTVVQAQFNYTTNNGTITITGYTGPDGAVAIPDTINGLPVTRIGEFAFFNSSSVTSVTIPDGVTSIEDFAFYHCTSVTNVTIPNSVTSIGNRAFESCYGLTSVTIPDSVSSIEYYAFSYCTSLTSVTIPDSVSSIDDGAFYYCTNLTSVSIPNSVISIGDRAFSYCTSLTNVTTGNGVTSIGRDAFYYCTSLTSIALPNSVTNIGSAAFLNCSLTSVTIPNSVISIGLGAFLFCPSLSAITVDALNSVYSSVDGVLFDKNRTLLIICPGGKTGSYSIPDSVTAIGDYAFNGCAGLSNVIIGANVTSIRNGVFFGCPSLSAITVDALNSVYSSVDGVLFDKSRTLLILCPGGKTGSYSIPDSVTAIGDYAFDSCYGLTSVTIPNNVTSIGSDAFFFCDSLSAITVDTLNSVYSSVDGVLFDKSQTLLIVCPGAKSGSYTIPDSVTSIGRNAFANCTSLTSVTIPDSVNSIGNYAFGLCTSLTSVTIPSSVSSIGDSAFGACSSLMGIYFQGNAPDVYGGVFSEASDVIVYYLPGTTGWEATFSERPTVLWNPVVATGDLSFGVRTNRFGFTITADSDLVIVVEAATNLSNPAWTPVGTNTLTGGASYFSDPEWTSHPARFYRLRSL